MSTLVVDAKIIAYLAITSSLEYSYERYLRKVKKYLMVLQKSREKVFKAN